MEIIPQCFREQSLEVFFGLNDITADDRSTAQPVDECVYPREKLGHQKPVPSRPMQFYVRRPAAIQAQPCHWALAPKFIQ